MLADTTRVDSKLLGENFVIAKINIDRAGIFITKSVV
jgi:hypothetical protein